MSGYRNYIGYGPKKTHLLILKPFGSKEIRAATATTGKIETATLKILIWESGCLCFDIFRIAYRWYGLGRPLRGVMTYTIALEPSGPVYFGETGIKSVQKHRGHER